MFTYAFHYVKRQKRRVRTSKKDEKNLPVTVFLEPAVGDCFLCGTGISRYRFGLCEAKKIARFGHCVISSNELDLQSLTESPCYFFQGCNGRISFTVFQFADVGLSDTGFLA